MNPFDLPDKQFLAFYAVLFVLALVAAGWLRRRLLQPSDEPTGESLRIGPYEIAYLFGSKRLAIDAVITRLVHDRVLAVELGMRRVKLGPEPLKANHPGGAPFTPPRRAGKGVADTLARRGSWRDQAAASGTGAPGDGRMGGTHLPLACWSVLPIGVVKFLNPTPRHRARSSDNVLAHVGLRGRLEFFQHRYTRRGSIGSTSRSTRPWPAGCAAATASCPARKWRSWWDSSA